MSTLAVGRTGWPWVVGAILLVAGAVALLAPVHDWTQAIEDSLETMSLLQGLLAFCAITLVGTLLMIPAWIFPIAAGAAFGIGWGIAAAVAASTLAALAAFLVARYVLRERIERAAKRNKSFAAVDKAVRREPWKVVALLRLSPVLPSGLKSYFLGLTCVDPVSYATASALGMLPGVLLKVYIGHAGRDALTGGPLKWAMLAAGVAATIAVMVIVGRAVRKRLKL
jgi:uncharacterized membrane protein YdjX (TVP38/TMEM64 family)